MYLLCIETQIIRIWMFIFILISIIFFCTRILVVLNNGCGPLGIHVIPTPLMGKGGGEKGGLLVEGVEEGGRVQQDGRIQVHDRIIDINGHSLLNTTFHQWVTQQYKETYFVGLINCT